MWGRKRRETSRIFTLRINKIMRVAPSKIFSFFKSKAIEELQNIEDIGPEVARSIFEFFHDSHNEKFAEQLSRMGIRIKSSQQSVVSSKLDGKTFVLTGTLRSMTRDEAIAKIRALGGNVTGSASKKTDYVLVGKETGGKYDRAKKLGIKVLDEKEFLQIIIS